MRRLVLVGVCVVLGGCVTTMSAQNAGFESRLPALEAIVTAARARPWGAELVQIPATVTEVGEFAWVPYLSFGGKDVEINVYGDPAHPAGIEVGTKSEAPGFRAGIRAFIAGLLAQSDRRPLDTLPEGRREEAGGLALEITLPTAPDAFGAWWVTASHPVGTQGAKATVGELGELAQPPKREFDDTLAVPEVGAHRAFFTAPRYRPVGPRVYATSYFKKDGVYHRRK